MGGGSRGGEEGPRQWRCRGLEAAAGSRGGGGAGADGRQGRRLDFTGNNRSRGWAAGRAWGLHSGGHLGPSWGSGTEAERPSSADQAPAAPRLRQGPAPVRPCRQRHELTQPELKTRHGFKRWQRAIGGQTPKRQRWPIKAEHVFSAKTHSTPTPTVKAFWKGTSKRLSAPYSSPSSCEQTAFLPSLSYTSRSARSFTLCHCILTSHLSAGTWQRERISILPPASSLSSSSSHLLCLVTISHNQLRKLHCIWYFCCIHQVVLASYF